MPRLDEECPNSCPCLGHPKVPLANKNTEANKPGMSWLRATRGSEAGGAAAIGSRAPDVVGLPTSSEPGHLLLAEES